MIQFSLPTLTLTSRQAQILDQAVRDYAGSDRAFAVRHAALPLYHGWTLTIALCTDGRLLQWENTDGELITEPLEIVFIRASLVRAAAIDPELTSLIPERPRNAFICDMCAGTGVIKQAELAASGLGCQCGGVGWLDPVVKHLDPLSLSIPLRVLAGLSGVAVLAILLTARCLEPSSDGFGTHQQLGLPPCTSVALFGIRCPSCGMTTSWSLATRGEFLAAGRINCGGLLLAIIALAYLPASCYFTWRGRSTRGAWFSMALGISILTSLAIAIAQWLWRLYS